jgi:hypothetical protein
MSPSSLILFAILLCAAGVVATVGLARLMPLWLLERARSQGRFAHLGEVESGAPARKTAACTHGVQAAGLRLV